MELKTKVNAEQGRQDILITREFDLPVELLFKAFEDPKIFEEWMGTNLHKLEFKPHGSFRFETSDPTGNIVFSANGTIHEIVPKKKITRTFQMEKPTNKDGSPFETQLEFLEFNDLVENRSKLTKHVICRSVTHRDEIMKMPFIQGMNMAYDRLENMEDKLIKTQS